MESRARSGRGSVPASFGTPSSERSSRRIGMAGSLLTGVCIGAVVFIISQKNYYFADDFFLFFLTNAKGPSLAAATQPIFSHFPAGGYWVFWSVGKLAGLDRGGASVFSAILVASWTIVIYLALWFAFAPERRFKTWWPIGLAGACVFGLLVSNLADAIAYFAKAATTLPAGLGVLSSSLLLSFAYWKRDNFASLMAGLVAASGLLFWELAAFHIVLVPIIAIGLTRMRSISLDRPKQPLETYARQTLLFFVTFGLCAFAYVLNYVTGGYGAGTAHPSLPVLVTGIADWLLPGFVGALGGGLLPERCSVLCYASSDFTHNGTPFILVIGVALITIGAFVKQLRYLLVPLLAAAILHGGAIAWGRVTLDRDFYLQSRYFADLAPFLWLFVAAVTYWSLAALQAPLARRLSSEPRTGASLRHRIRQCDGFSVALAGILIVASAAAVGGYRWVTVVHRFGGTDRAHYVRQLLTAVQKSAGPTTLLSVASSPVLGMNQAAHTPFDDVRSLLRVEIGDGYWLRGSGRDLTIPSDAGTISAAKSARSWRYLPSASAQRADCSTEVVAAPSGDVPGVPSGDVPGILWRTVLLEIQSSRAQEVVIYAGSQSFSRLIPRGRSRVTLQSHLPSVAIGLTTGSACILSGRGLIAVPE